MFGSTDSDKLPSTAILKLKQEDQHMVPPNSTSPPPGGQPENPPSHSPPASTQALMASQAQLQLSGELKKPPLPQQITPERPAIQSNNSIEFLFKGVPFSMTV